MIVQSFESGKVLMLAYMNELAWNKTVETGKAHYWSRSRHKLWVKGEESGNIQLVREILIDCDSDTILLKVDQIIAKGCAIEMIFFCLVFYLVYHSREH